jgi:hypothetical protein
MLQDECLTTFYLFLTQHILSMRGAVRVARADGVWGTMAGAPPSLLLVLERLDSLEFNVEEAPHARALVLNPHIKTGN